jgi:hypothetical protein
VFGLVVQQIALGVLSAAQVLFDFADEAGKLDTLCTAAAGAAAAAVTVVLHIDRIAVAVPGSQQTAFIAIFIARLLVFGIELAHQFFIRVVFKAMTTGPIKTSI